MQTTFAMASPGLPAPREMTGCPIVEVYISSESPHRDVDLFAYLVCYRGGPGGEGATRYLTEGCLKASHRSQSRDETPPHGEGGVRVGGGRSGRGLVGGSLTTATQEGTGSTSRSHNQKDKEEGRGKPSPPSLPLFSFVLLCFLLRYVLWQGIGWGCCSQVAI